jgi:hypothetical protein
MCDKAIITNLLIKFYKRLIVEYTDERIHPPKGKHPYHRWAIPDDLCGPCIEPKEICLFGDLAKSYHEVLLKMKSEKGLEYLGDELNRILCHLTCDIIINKELFKKDQNNLKEEIEGLLKHIYRHIDTYEIIIPVTNVNIRGSEIVIGDVLIKQFKMHELENWCASNDIFKDINIHDFVDKTLAVISEQGTNFDLVCRRARKKAAFAVRVLQVSIKANERIRDDQALLDIGEFLLARRKDDLSFGGYEIDRSSKPSLLDINGQVYGEINRFITKISDVFENGTLPEKLQNRFRRSLIWIGQSIDDEDYDIKIIKLCTALESILVTKDDRKKGEALAYRMMLLYAIKEHDYFHLNKILDIYELRSKIIHDGEKGLISDKQYRMMVRQVIETIVYTIQIVREQKIKNIGCLIYFLESSEYMDKVYKWLVEQDDKFSMNIKKAIDEKKTPQKQRQNLMKTAIQRQIDSTDKQIDLGLKAL